MEKVSTHTRRHQKIEKFLVTTTTTSILEPTTIVATRTKAAAAIKSAKELLIKENFEAASVKPKGHSSRPQRQRQHEVKQERQQQQRQQQQKSENSNKTNKENTPTSRRPQNNANAFECLKERQEIQATNKMSATKTTTTTKASQVKQQRSKCNKSQKNACYTSTFCASAAAPKTKIGANEQKSHNENKQQHQHNREDHQIEAFNLLSPQLTAAVKAVTTAASMPPTPTPSSTSTTPSSSSTSAFLSYQSAAAVTAASTTTATTTASEIFPKDFFNDFNHCRRWPMQCINSCSTANICKLFSYVSLSGSCGSTLSVNFNIGKYYCGSGIGGAIGQTNFDLRSFLYVALLILIYCSVLIRASATAATTANSTTTTATASAAAAAAAATTATTPATAPPTSIETHMTNVENSFANNIDNVAAVELTNITTIHINSTIDFAVFENLTIILNTANNANETLLQFNASHRIKRRDAANVPDDDDDSSYHDDEFDEYDALIKNKSAKGKYIGAPCNDMKCDATLLHVICDKETLTCGCEKNYPVQLGLIKGCDKPKKLGEQCFYDETCMYNDENSLCVQVRHNALCQCANGFHSVSYTKPKRQVFCTQDLKELTSDLPTLLGVTTGIAVLAGLICMVLHLFSKTKYPRHRNFGDANIPPPIMYSSDTGIPLTVQSGRPSSRSSLRSSGSIGSYGNRRSSSGGGIAGGIGGGGTGTGGGIGSNAGGGSKGILVSTSRTGSRRPSLASVHSTSSSVRSYSMMRFEKETQQKEIRQEMKLRLARLQQQQQMSQNKPQIIIGDTLSILSGRGSIMDHGASGSGGAIGIVGNNPTANAVTTLSRLNMSTPSPLTPNSTDELLPAVDELQEYPTKSDILPMTSISKPKETINVAAATLTAVKDIASTSAAAAKAKSFINKNASAAEMSPKKKSTNETAAGTTSTSAKQLDKDELAEAGAYIGPCSSSTEAL